MRSTALHLSKRFAKRLIAASSFVLLSLLGTVADAQIEGNPENWCRAGFFTRDTTEFKIGVVKRYPANRPQRTNFHRDDSDKCPGGAGCEQKAYVFAGDELVVNRTYKGYACSWYAPAKGSSTVGWINIEDLEFPEKLDDASPKAWIGEWRYADNTISFTHNKLDGWLNATGNAFWKGFGANIHVGELDGRVEPRNGVAEYSDGDDEYDCKATMRLFGNYLVVSDNMKCGGANVTFSGIYRRR